MKKLITSYLILFAVTAEAKISQQLLESFQSFATRDLVMFGAPKGTTLNFTESFQGYFVQANQTILGSAVSYERCLVQLDDKDSVQLNCHEGMTASMDICKIAPAICQKEGVQQKLRELYLDPDIVSGDVMRGLGQQKLNPHMGSLTGLVKKHASARKVIAQAMTLNGCTSIELGDIEGQITHKGASTTRLNVAN